MMDSGEKKIKDEELEQINGGTDTIIQTRRSKCPRCDAETIFNLYTGGRAICQDCGYEKML